MVDEPDDEEGEGDEEKERRGTGVVCFLYKDGFVSFPLLTLTLSTD